MIETTIGNACKRFSSGSGISAKDIHEAGKYPVFGGNGIRGYTDTFNFNGECAIIGRQGAYCGNTRYFAGKAYMTEHAIVAEATDENVSGYLAYLFSIMNLAQYQGQSAQPGLSVQTLSKVAISIPDKSDQKRIFDILNSFDKMIKTNNSICSDLEAMAKLLYDYWFVQFDFPDENGKPYKSSGGKMVWNEELKREIPEGWEVHPLQDFIATSKNGDWGNEAPKKETDIQVRCFRGADFSSITSNYQTTAPIRFISKNNADRLLSDGDLVIEISGGSPVQSTGRIGYISQKFLDRCGGIMDCSNFCKAFTPRKRLYQYWLYQTWKMYYDAGVMFNFESKTTGIKNLMFDSVVRDIKVPTPPDPLLREYQQTVSLYYDKTQESFMESSELASLRDFLLPMLMNGQVQVLGRI